ncbi:MAG: hypothetical protein KAJ19_10895, partial [Gammaproteobacteria bacterium]|nr:hypothetical protein [Gammaproteobacteria bacterium]
MSVEITTAMVEQYKGNVELLSQQKGSRLRDSVMTETVVGKNAYFEQIGATAAQKKTTRHQDTPQTDTPHARRRVSMDDYVWADFVDNEDKIRTLIDPTSPYAVNAVMAFGRSIDDVIIAAATGTAYTGVAGGTATSLPSTYDQGTSASNDGLTLAKLIGAKGAFWTQDVDEDEQLHIAVASKQLQDLLNLEKVTSADYVTIKALVNGEIDTYMGFKFHRTQRLAISATDVRTCFAWVQSGVKLGL